MFQMAFDLWIALVTLSAYVSRQEACRLGSCGHHTADTLSLGNGRLNELKTLKGKCLFLGATQGSPEQQLA